MHYKQLSFSFTPLLHRSHCQTTHPLTSPPPLVRSHHRLKPNPWSSLTTTTTIRKEVYESGPLKTLVTKPHHQVPNPDGKFETKYPLPNPHHHQQRRRNLRCGVSALKRTKHRSESFSTTTTTITEKRVIQSLEITNQPVNSVAQV